MEGKGDRKVTQAGRITTTVRVINAAGGRVPREEDRRWSRSVQRRIQDSALQSTYISHPIWKSRSRSVAEGWRWRIQAAGGPVWCLQSVMGEPRFLLVLHLILPSAAQRYGAFTSFSSWVWSQSNLLKSACIKWQMLMGTVKNIWVAEFDLKKTTKKRMRAASEWP